MQITTESQTSYTTKTDSQKDTSGSALTSKFKLETLLEKSPDKITFNNYKHLTYSDLEEIYKDDPEALFEAKFLKRSSNYSNNEILNKTMFEKAKSLETKEERIKMIGLMFFTSGMDENGNLEIDIEYDSQGRPIIKNTSSGEYPTLNAEFVSSKEVVKFLDILLEHFETNLNEGESEGNSSQKEFSSNSINLINDIKHEYLRNEKENEELLSQATKKN